MAKPRTAIYPGTFDPLTNGHYDLIVRAGHLFDRLIIAVAQHSGKSTLFSQEERVELVRRCTEHLPFVEVRPFHGLLVNFAKELGVTIIVRGMRVVSDFEFEFQIALSNRKMWPELETAFLLTNENYSYMSSSLVRQIGRLKGNLKPFVPPIVEEAMSKKLSSMEQENVVI